MAAGMEVARDGGVIVSGCGREATCAAIDGDGGLDLDCGRDCASARAWAMEEKELFRPIADVVVPPDIGRDAMALIMVCRGISLLLLRVWVCLRSARN